MRDIDRVLRVLTPRVATVVLLRFDEVTELCEKRFGCRLTQADRRFLVTVSRSILTGECQTSRSDRAT
jgi:hypothetical protein